MNELFINQHKREKSVYKELATYGYLRNPSILIFYIAFSIFCITGTIKGERKVIFLAALIMFFVILAVKYFRYIKYGYKKEMELSSGELATYTLTFFDERIVFQSSFGTSIDIDYAIIKKVVSSKSYYFLFTNQNQTFVVKKDGFIKGNEEEFVTFMKQKCSKKQR